MPICTTSFFTYNLFSIIYDFPIEPLRHSALFCPQMTFGNLGTCFGPALLRDSQDFDPMNESLMISQIISDIIENKDYLFAPSV